jgi:hypothetical protein
VAWVTDESFREEYRRRWFTFDVEELVKIEIGEIDEANGPPGWEALVSKITMVRCAWLTR